jgi:TolB protein
VQAPFSPAIFTPDGAAIVFSIAKGKDCFLYRTGIAGGTTRRLTGATSGCESDPAFSPDGQHLAFMYALERGAHGSLMLASPDGASPRALVSSQEDNLQPVFVPHSDQILFLRSGAFEHYSPLVDNRRHKLDLFSVDLVSGSVSALTQQKFYECSHVSVSADGEQIIVSVSTYPEGSHFLILPIGEKGASAQNLQPRVPNGPTPPAIYNAVWVPDGRSVIFSAASQPPEGDFNYNVYRLDTSSGATEQLTALTGLLDGFSVSADGKKAVLLRQGAYSILDLSTHQLTPIRIDSGDRE